MSTKPPPSTDRSSDAKDLLPSKLLSKLPAAEVVKPPSLPSPAPEAISTKVLSLQDFVTELEIAMRTDGVGWCSIEKATSLASMIWALRPAVVVELGVWMGGSALPMAIALRALGAGQLVAVDAWSTDVSIAGQDDPRHRSWWGETVGDRGHAYAYQVFVKRLRKHGISPDRCRVLCQQTDEAEVPPTIDILHHDANHGPQVVADIDRWTPAVRVGGFLVVDDLDWTGGHVVRARDRALELGFIELYPLGTGCVMQRVRGPGRAVR